MADLGRCLFDELEKSVIEVKYIIDKNPGIMSTVLNFSTLEEKLLVDTIIVTVAAREQMIVNEIKRKGYAHVIGLSDIFEYFKQ